jgi:hypothetical protein
MTILCVVTTFVKLLREFRRFVYFKFVSVLPFFVVMIDTFAYAQAAASSWRQPASSSADVLIQFLDVWKLSVQCVISTGSYKVAATW